jgi:hypothetical protein
MGIGGKHSNMIVGCSMGKVVETGGGRRLVGPWDCCT